MKALFIGVICILSVLISHGYSTPSEKRPEIHPKYERTYLDLLLPEYLRENNLTFPKGEYLRENNLTFPKGVPKVTIFDKHEETDKKNKAVEHNAKENSDQCKGGDKCEMRNKAVEHNAKENSDQCKGGDKCEMRNKAVEHNAKDTKNESVLKSIFLFDKPLVPLWITSPIYFICEKIFQFIAYLAGDDEYREIGPLDQYLI
ncbi:unnamed protein product [Trichobilharzia szidati]|nr:unnamed protein product [Trichobilharzia szidati]